MTEHEREYIVEKIEKYKDIGRKTTRMSLIGQIVCLSAVILGLTGNAFLKPDIYSFVSQVVTPVGGISSVLILFADLFHITHVEEFKDELQDILDKTKENTSEQEIEKEGKSR